MKRAWSLIGLSALVLPLAALAAGESKLPPIPAEYKTNGFAVGCQAYTFNRFSAFEAIEKTAQAGGKVIEFYPDQKLSKDEPNLKVSHDASPEVLAKLKAKLAKHHLKAINYGVVGVSKNEAEARKVFELAKNMGMRAITTESTDAIDTLEKLAKEYNIGVAFHNHPRQPRNPNYKVWDPKYIAELVKDRDARLGACADTGHWARSGLDPVEGLKTLKGRVISTHLKDLNARAPDAHDVPYGTGVCNIKGCLDELRAQGFQGNISIEYEYNWNNSVPDVTKCIDFIREYKR